MLEVNDFDAVRISLASPEQIRSWSYGEVTKPETINYRTLKPERDGLFCERIFGPTKDFECFCGKYKRIRYKGVICDKCGVEVARAKVRRERMGHIELACPVSHIWFAKGIPSRIGLLLDMSPRKLERVLYFSHYIVTSVSEEARRELIKQLDESGSPPPPDTQEAPPAAEAAPGEPVAEAPPVPSAEDEPLEEEITEGTEKLRELKEGLLLTETQYRELKDKYGEVFEAGMGADAILKILKNLNLDEVRSRLLEEIRSSSGQRRKKASKQLQMVEAFRRSGNKPEWEILTVLPVLPPDLRPMVQLDGGRFATSDLNDLYRRVINRNNRLRHLLDMGAPEIIVRNEKRMLQEAVDSLIDNSRRGRAVSTDTTHKLRSLADMLRGKQGRFRQNLLGKRVDYSGRSVIVVGPELKLNQCGLPRRMALELFKPFVMNRLVQQELAHNIKSARRLVERGKPEVYDILEEVVKERPVLLNRAPTLHRLSIQAFEPVLIDGSAIQIHPLVCSAFNADFDGDQMAVHVPLSHTAVKEAREIMLSIHNMLVPSSGEPIVSPTLDIVLGSYYLTTIRAGAKGEGKGFGSFEEARLAHDLGMVDLRAEITVRDAKTGGEKVKTSVGRIIFNEAIPEEMGFVNRVVDKSGLKALVSQGYKILKHEVLADMLDNIKRLGFRCATLSGTTIAMSDIEVPQSKYKLLEEAKERVTIVENQFHRGLITEDERYNSTIGVWMETTDRITDIISQTMDRFGGVFMMATSGAKGNISQIKQMAGMRGLMTNPAGRIIDFPIRSSLREGLSVLEYFISTHGARKGLADTALRTSDSGYLTRRLIDVAQDVITIDYDCETTDGVWIRQPRPGELLPPLIDRILGRMAATPVVHPQTGEVIVDRNQEIDEVAAQAIIAAGITEVHARSALTCQSRHGACRLCYGRDLARGRLVDPNTAVGIIAAQSIGEPGTQLTLRTFHTGGVVGRDITSGLPRVEEIFEARTPKGQAIISEIDGVAEVATSDEGAVIRVSSSESYRDEYTLPPRWKRQVKHGEQVVTGAVLAIPPTQTKAEAAETTSEAVTQPLRARVTGKVSVEKGQLYIQYVEEEKREYPVSAAVTIQVKPGDRVKAGQQLTEGSINPQDILHVMGKDAVQQYLVEEVQKVYRSQGVNINDKHIEVISRQMLTKVRIDSSGDTELVPGELADRFRYEDINAKVLAEGGEPATAHTVLLGITRASLNTNSWLAAASFQETTRVLTEAAIRGEVDRLSGLKENVIIGKLIPARAILPVEAPKKEEPPQLVAAGEEPQMEAEAVTEEAEEAAEAGEAEDIAGEEGETAEPDEAGEVEESDKEASDEV